MAGQEILASVYVLVGLALACAPIVYVILRKNTSVPASIGLSSSPDVLAIAFFLIAAAIAMIEGAFFLAGGLVLAAVAGAFAAQERVRTFLLVLAAVGASGTLLWWKFDASHKLVIEPEQLLLFSALPHQQLFLYFGIPERLFLFFAVAAIIFIGMFFGNFRNSKVDVLILIAIVAFILQHSLNTSVLTTSDIYTAIRHHWGAYIGPSETALSGARLLYDIPAQYGLGPTLLIAAVCGKNCWVGMYWVTTLASIIYALIVVASAAVIVRRIDNSWTYATILLAAAAACMLWTSYPPLLGAPWSYPSTGGLRFIPLSALLLFILWSESRPAEARPSRVFGYIIWCLGAVWSPEAAFYLSFVWWPYLVWRAGAESLHPLRAVLLRAVEILAVTAAFLVVCVSAYYLLYGVFPSLDVYDAYVVNPTGPQPPNPFGSIWFFGFVMISGLGAAALLIRNRDTSREFAGLFACILALFAVFSYYIGRSHDNNILNIMPYMILILATMPGFLAGSAVARGAGVAIASTLAAALLFDWSAWRQDSWSDYANATAPASMSYIRGATAEQSGAAALPAADPGSDPAIAAQPAEKSRIDGANPADAARAVFYVSSTRGEPLIKIDDGLDIAPIGPRAWSAIHDPIDFYFLPDALVSKLIDRTMRRIKSPGWLVIGKHVDNVPETLRWQRLIEGSYTKTEEKDFGAYHAIRYEPKLQ